MASKEDLMITPRVFSYLRLETGNLLHFHGDALVIDVNEDLTPVPGASRAVFEVAGPDFLSSIKAHGPIKQGEAFAVPGGALDRVTHVILVAPPKYQDGQHGEEETLKECYKNVFRVAKEQGLSKLAFTSLGTWVYNYPRFPAAKIALLEALEFLAEQGEEAPFRFTIYCFDKTSFRNYGMLMNLLIEEIGEGKPYARW
jgi:O-acetyl-ADP-ribose deacetylase (regulator of RNase III)